MARYHTHELGECNSQWAREFPLFDRLNRESDWLITIHDRLYWIPRRGPVTIGSDSNNEICVCDSNVSARHAQLQILADRMLLIDLGSSTGTWVDGERIGKYRLRGGELVEVGALKLSISRIGVPDS